MSEPTESKVWRIKEGARALIVGNTTDFTLTLDPFLRSIGFEVYIAFSASDAARAARSVVFDIVIINSRTQENEARGICEALREIVGYGETPVIALTDPLPPWKGKAAPHPCYTASFQKPIDFKALLTLIESLG